jgi:hypothetical protein
MDEATGMRATDIDKYISVCSSVPIIQLRNSL